MLKIVRNTMSYIEEFSAIWHQADRGAPLSSYADTIAVLLLLCSVCPPPTTNNSEDTTVKGGGGDKNLFLKPNFLECLL